MKTWQKAIFAGACVELILLLLSGVLLMSSITPAGPEGILAQLSEIVQFPGCQLMEMVQIKSFPVTALFMFLVNTAAWTVAAFLFFSLKTQKNS